MRIPRVCLGSKMTLWEMGSESSSPPEEATLCALVIWSTQGSRHRRLAEAEEETAGQDGWAPFLQPHLPLAPQRVRALTWCQVVKVRSTLFPGLPRAKQSDFICIRHVREPLVEKKEERREGQNKSVGESGAKRRCRRSSKGKQRG